jgi:hypothetical protein
MSIFLRKTGFCPSTLCLDPVTATIAIVAMAGSSIYSGIQADKAAKKQASAIEDQARLAREESEVTATRKETERRKFLAEQRMAYLATGVSLEGTPLIVGDETWKEFQIEIDAIRRSGSAQSRYLETEASTTRSMGRAQLVSGVLEGVGTAAMGGYKMGAFRGSGSPSVTTTYYPTETILG